MLLSHLLKMKLNLLLNLVFSFVFPLCFLCVNCGLFGFIYYCNILRNQIELGIFTKLCHRVILDVLVIIRITTEYI